MCVMVCKKSFTNSQPLVQKCQKTTGPQGRFFTLYRSRLQRSLLFGKENRFTAVHPLVGIQAAQKQLSDSLV